MSEEKKKPINTYACKHGAGTAPCAICQTEELKSMNPDELLKKDAEEEAKELLLYFVCPKNKCTIKKTCFDCAVIGEKISRRILSFHSKHQEEWKKELQRLTPGGSEFTEPKECGDYLRRMKDQKHEAMLKLKHQDERVKNLEADNKTLQERTKDYPAMSCRVHDLEKNVPCLVKACEDYKKEIDSLEARVKELEAKDVGLDEHGRVSINEYRSKVGAEAGRALRLKLDEVVRSIRPAHNIKNKIIARMALAATHGEAFVILRQTLGNGVIPSLTLKQLKAPESK